MISYNWNLNFSCILFALIGYEDGQDGQENDWQMGLNVIHAKLILWVDVH